MSLRALVRDAADDLRYGWRHLHRSPAFAAVAILTLALGVGANTLGFSVLYGAVFRRLAFAESERLVVLQVEREAADRSTSRFPWTWGQFRWLGEQETPFERMATFTVTGVNLSGGEEPARAGAEVVSGDYFATLGARAGRGRVIQPADDDRIGAHPVAVISDALWRSRFGADAGIVGRTIRANRVPLTVIGVMPPGFTGVSEKAELWVPETMAPQVVFDRQLTSDDPFHSVIARLRGGILPNEADARLASLGTGLLDGVPTAESADGARSLRVSARPLAEAGIDPARRRGAALLFGAVWLVLAVACVNLATLQLSRAAMRGRELALRAALGAARGRLVRQLVAEHVLLVACGCAAGVLLALVGARALAAIAPASLVTPGNMYGAVSGFASVRLDGRVLLFAIVTSVFTGLITVIVPMLRSGRQDLTGELGRTRAGVAAGGLSLRRFGPFPVLMTIQVALAFVLATNADLVVRSLASLWRLDPGFDPSSLITFRIDPPDPAFSTADAPAHIRPILERVQSMAGVEGATVSMCTPYMATCGRKTLFTPGGAGVVPAEHPVGVHYVGADHFRVMRMRLLGGRQFAATDRRGAPRVAIVGATAAARLWPGQNPIGRRFTFDDAALLAIPDSTIEVVGVVNDVTYWPVNEPPRADVYTPYEQFTYASTYVIARTSAPPRTMIATLRAAVRGADADLPLDDVRTMEERAGVALSGDRFVARVLTAFAALALTLTAIGVHGVAAYNVSQRTRELGLRLAVGSRPGQLLRLVLRDGLSLSIVGIVVGAVGAVALARVVRGFVPGLGAASATPLLSAAAVVLVASFVALLVPARRAARTDPMVALRAE